MGVIMKNYFKILIVAAILIAVIHIYYSISNVHHDHPDDPQNLIPHGHAVVKDSVKPIPDYHPNTTVDLRIIVITYDRYKSLARCLESLNEAEYFGDKVTIDIWIDKSSKSASVDKDTLDAASAFKFNHGTVNVHAREEHAGLIKQWVTTWVPDPDSKEIALFVEDDLTLSKFFYKWLKLVHKKYDSYPNINGYALQGKSIKHGVGAKGMLHGPEEEVVFSYPILGSWGFSPSRDNWRHFLEWFKQASADTSFIPKVPGSLTTVWYEHHVKLGKRDKIWTQWHVYHAYQNKELTLYVNLPGRAGLAINWEEPGLHYHGKAKTTNKDPILKEWDDKLADLPDSPTQIDIQGKIVKPAQKHI